MKCLTKSLMYAKGFITGVLLLILSVLSFCYVYLFYKGGIKKSFWKDFFKLNFITSKPES